MLRKEQMHQLCLGTIDLNPSAGTALYQALQEPPNIEVCNLSELERTTSTQLDAIDKVIDAIHRSDDIIVILGTATEQIYRSINCDFVNILFHNSSAKHFYIHRSLTEQNSVAGNMIIIPYHETSITDIIRSHNSVVRDDLTQRGLMTPGDLKFLSHDIKSDLSVPIIRKNQVIAILHLSSFQAHFFTEELIFQAEQFANLLSLAFERTELTEQLNRHQSNLAFWKNKFDSLFEHIDEPVAMIRTNDDMICCYNPAFQHLTGFPPEKLNGMRLSSLHPEQNELILSKLDKFSLQTVCSDLGEIQLVGNDERRISANLRLVAVPGDHHFVYAIYQPLCPDRVTRYQGIAGTSLEYGKDRSLLAVVEKLMSLSEEPRSMESLIQSALLILKKIVDFDFAQLCLIDADKAIVNIHTMISDASRQFSQFQDWMLVEQCKFFWYRVDQQNLMQQVMNQASNQTIERKLRSRIATALDKGKQFLGTLLLGSLKADQYQMDHLEVIKQLAGSITWLIDHAQRASESQKLKLIEQGKFRLEKLIDQDDRIEPLLMALTKLSAEWLNAKFASLHFVEPEFSISRSIVSDVQCNPSAIANFEREKILSVALANSDFYLIEKIPNQEIFDLNCLKIPIADCICYLAIPLQWKGEPIALLINYFSKPYTDSPATALHVAVLKEIGGDIIRQVKFYQNLAQRLERLERAVEWASDTIDNFAHDLKAPAASIQALASAAIAHVDQAENSEALEYLKKIRSRSHHLQLYVDALGKFADFDLAALGHQPIDSGELLTEVVQQFQPVIQQRHIKLHIQKNLPAIQADRQLLYQLFAQLIDSAIHQLAERNVRPTIEISYRSGSGKDFFVISNNGPVMQNGQLHQLFEVPDMGEDLPNNGIHQRLNLAIAKKIVELHDGQIWYESAPEKGNRFYLRLPVKS